LELGQTYYWAIDEVNTLHPESPWEGRVWSFTMSECLSLDNMEDYNDRKGIRGVWTDGYASTVWMTQDPWLNIQGGSSGSNLNVSTEVGSPVQDATGPIPPTPWNTQAMVFHYDNDGLTYTGLPGEEQWVYDAPYFSEIEANTVENLDVGKNWADEGVKALSMRFQGHPISDGSCSFANWPEFTVTGRGRDIGGRHDEFYFLALHPWTVGGASAYIQARVVSIDPTDPSAKAGLMIREKLTPYSRYAAVFVAPGGGITFQWREYEDGASDSRSETTNTAPQYLRLDRTAASYFTASYSSDGWTWADVNVVEDAAGDTTYQEVLMDEPSLYAGAVVTSGTSLATCTADFNNFDAYPWPTTWVWGNVGTNTAEQLYVALSDGTTTAVVNHPDPCAATLTDWQEWNIELTEFTGVDMHNVEKVYIGFGNRDSHPDSGGSGTVYFDDIRACPPRCVASIRKPYADIAGPDGVGVYDCIVKEEDLAVLAGDWLLRDELITTVEPTDVNLTAHYQFEDTFLDSGPHGYHATDPCGTNPGFAPGAIGKALSLDGADDHLVVGSVGIDGNTPRTIAGWAKANQPASAIVDWTNVFGFTSLQRADLGNLSFDINRRGGEDFYCIHAYGWEENILPLDQEWHHLAATYDGGTIRWYGDGIPGGTNTTISTVRLINTEDNVQIGKRGHDAGGNWPGLVDEFRIYSYVLSDAEIVYLATKGAATL
ncbi:MAG: LamG domain-containing protein, partial [Dehalococcoidales bacterium]